MAARPERTRPERTGPERRAGARPDLRRGARDDLGLRRALGDRMLPMLVAAMTFLAALALAGSVGAAALSRHWREGAGAALTVQVPRPEQPAADGQGSRLPRVVTILRGTPGIGSVRPLADTELAELLRPWLGEDSGRLALPLPAVIEVHLAAADAPDLAALAARLRAVAPDTLAESHGVWLRRLSALARSLEACAWLALLLVTSVAAAVVAIATRAGLAARREAIEIVHGLGATDGYIAGRFAARATKLAGIGGAAGALAALPVLLVLADLAAPFAGSAATIALPQSDAPVQMLLAWLATLPPALWLALPCLPPAAALIGCATAQGTVRRWLRRLP